MLGIYETTAQQNMTPYAAPQECGNRTGVRWAEVTDENGLGMRFSSEDGMNVSVLPYTPHEVENARHAYELPPVTKNRGALHHRSDGRGRRRQLGRQNAPRRSVPSCAGPNLPVCVRGHRRIKSKRGTCGTRAFFCSVKTAHRVHLTQSIGVFQLVHAFRPHWLTESREMPNASFRFTEYSLSGRSSKRV